MNIARIAVMGFFAAIIAVIVFVRAGAQGGRSGGQQSADILNAGGDSLAKIASGLEGG